MPALCQNSTLHAVHEMMALLAGADSRFTLAARIQSDRRGS